MTRNSFSEESLWGTDGANDDPRLDPDSLLEGLTVPQRAAVVQRGGPLLVIAGAGDMVSGLGRMTVWNQSIPDTLRGRLAGIEMLSYSSGPTLGNVEAGILERLVGLRTSIVAGGALCVGVTAVLALSLPAFWHYDAREGEKLREAPS